MSGAAAADEDHKEADDDSGITLSRFSLLESRIGEESNAERRSFRFRFFSFLAISWLTRFWATSKIFSSVTISTPKDTDFLSFEGGVSAGGVTLPVSAGF
eukprot:g5748.t1